MQQERWRRVDEIFHQALELDGHRRTSFLEETCSDDQDLRLELQRLLLRHEQAASFLEAPALEMAALDAATTNETNTTGAAVVEGWTISHYQMLAKLGSGGMGVVYEAEDIRLKRRVALKLLADNLVPDTKAGQRFEAEARAASSLNHPNICTVYGVEEYDGRTVIVMELLKGENLKQKIRAGGAVPFEQLLELGMQAADALAAAHGQGIVHRDIKPANIFLCSDGRLKLVDFGIAKVARSAEQMDAAADESLTLHGNVVGTIFYMSPEQIRGEGIDSRSDLFSLGAVLYELATGQRPFSRGNPLLTVDAILHDEAAAPSRLNRALPPSVDRVILKLLEKHPERRYQQASELRRDLKALMDGEQSAGEQSAPGTAAPMRRRWKAVSAVCVALVGGFAGVRWYGQQHHDPALTQKDTIVLADFINKTGDPVFDGTLRQGLSVQLQESPFLSLISEDRIQQTLRLMQQPAAAPLTPELAREVCARLGSTATLEGSIARLGSEYLLGFRARACGTGAILDEQQAQFSKKEDILSQLGRMATRFRSKAGESLATIRQHETPLVEATTSSLEALKAYSTAWKVLSTSGPTDTIPLLQRAIELDPNFAMAHAFLGRNYGDLWEGELSKKSLMEAYRLRDRASDYERFFITLNFHQQVTGDAEKARQTGELWAQVYSRSVAPHAALSWIHQMFGRYGRSVAEAKQAIVLDPDFTPGYANLGWAYVFLEQWKEAEEALRQAQDRKLDMPDLVLMRYYLAFLKEDTAAMERLPAQGVEKSGVEDWISQAQASVAGYYGRVREARSLSRRAVEFARQANAGERAGLYEAGTAVREAFFGDAAEARRRVGDARGFSNGRDVVWGSALALALTGDLPAAHALAVSLEKRYPEDTYVRFTYLPVLQAINAIERGDARRAIDLLQMPAPFDLAVPGSWSGFFGNLYPVYFRGVAYLAAGENQKAAASFQKILDHPGLMFSDPAMLLARLQLGRAMAKAGDLSRARKSYEDVLQLWKSADDDLPLRKQAEVEYAKLRFRAADP